MNPDEVIIKGDQQTMTQTKLYEYSKAVQLYLVRENNMTVSYRRKYCLVSVKGLLKCCKGNICEGSALTNHRMSYGITELQ